MDVDAIASIQMLAASRKAMKSTVFIIIMVLLMSCGQSSPDERDEREVLVSIDTTKVVDRGRGEKLRIPEQVNSNPTDSINYQSSSLNSEFENVKHFKLTDSIAADFNGDGQEDQAIFRKEGGTSGIIITHGKSNEEIKIGFGQKFGYLTEFNWVDFWGLVEDSTTYEIIIENAEIIGDTTVRLRNPSIVIRKEEVGGGVITFRNGRYEWVHQSD